VLCDTGSLLWCSDSFTLLLGCLLLLYQLSCLPFNPTRLFSTINSCSTNLSKGENCTHVTHMYIVYTCTHTHVHVQTGVCFQGVNVRMIFINYSRS
jgi:hypothetical protein